MTAPGGVVHAVVPGDVDDVRVPSGGNVYDRRVLRELERSGWTVHEVAAVGTWPRPDAGARAGLLRALEAIPDGALVLVDGIVACGVPEVTVPQARRLRVVVLVHLPLADETGLAPHVAERLDAAERRVVRAASAVVTTSRWAARLLGDRHGIAEQRVHVVEPGTDPAPVAPGGGGAARLLCVAAVTPRKGHDVLVEALSSVADLPWSCSCVGSLDRAPEYVTRVRGLIEQGGLDDRVAMPGPRTGERLSASYAGADVLVLPSRGETYGMVVTEALARGIPVLATAAGAVPETLGSAADGSVPGMLVPPDDAAALAAALRCLLTDGDVWRRARASALSRRGMLNGWAESSRELADVLARIGRERT